MSLCGPIRPSMQLPERTTHEFKEPTLWFTRGMDAIPRSATAARQTGRASDGGSGGMASTFPAIVEKITPLSLVSVSHHKGAPHLFLLDTRLISA